MYTAKHPKTVRTKKKGRRYRRLTHVRVVSHLRPVQGRPQRLAAYDHAKAEFDGAREAYGRLWDEIRAAHGVEIDREFDVEDGTVWLPTKAEYRALRALLRQMNRVEFEMWKHADAVETRLAIADWAEKPLYSSIELGTGAQP